MDEKAICLLCHVQVTEFKRSKLERHMQLKHEELRNQPAAERNVHINKLKETYFAKKQYCIKPKVDRILMASYKICHQIAVRGKVWTEGEIIKDCLLIAAKTIHNNSLEFEKIQLSTSTVERRVRVLAANIQSQIVDQLNQACYIGIAID